MSHELFHDVTDRRPRANRAAGGTLAISIVGHALVLAAVIVVPLIATDALPTPAEAISAFAIVDKPIPEPPPAPSPRTQPTTVAPTRNVTSYEPANEIAPELPRVPSTDFTVGVVDPTAMHQFGIDGGTGAPQPPQPPPPVVPDKPLRLSSVQMPRKVRDVAPIYPRIAQQAGVEGIVIVEAVIGADGLVRDARVLRSQPLLDRAALDAVREWRYE